MTPSRTTERTSRETTVSLRVYDVTGRLAAERMNGKVAGAGRHEVVREGEDRDGRSVSSGVYFYRL